MIVDGFDANDGEKSAFKLWCNLIFKIVYFNFILVETANPGHS